MNIILFGFKGSGKTHLGKLLSIALKRPFMDTDDLMIKLYEEKHGKQLSIREIHQLLGEADFRVLEKTAIHNLQPSSPCVIALGGGAALDLDNINYLQKVGQLVYLKVSFNTIQKRILNGLIPSFVDSKNPIESLHQIYQQRIPVYESIAARCIDADFLNEADCIKTIRSLLFLEEPQNGF